MMDYPKHIDDLEGPLYTLTHPRTVTQEIYRPLLLSCFEGEHGDVAKAVAFALADHAHIAVPPCYTRPNIGLTLHQQSGKLEDK